MRATSCNTKNEYKNVSSTSFPADLTAEERRMCPVRRRRKVRSQKAQKRRQRRALIAGWIVGACAVFVVTLLLFLTPFFSTKVSARDSGLGNYYKYYTAVRIEEGDTLWSLAEEYRLKDVQTIHDYIQEAREINHLYDDNIRSGEYLILPYFSETLVTD